MRVPACWLGHLGLLPSGCCEPPEDPRSRVGTRCRRRAPSAAPPHGQLAPVSLHRDKPALGSPQVYYLGEGEASRRWLQQEHNTKARLCLSHMKAVACHVLARHPATRPLVWDDMLRAIPEDQLAGGQACPRLWWQE